MAEMPFVIWDRCGSGSMLPDTKGAEIKGGIQMKKRTLTLMLALAMASTLSMSAAAGDEDYDFYIFNGKGEIADSLQAAVDQYSAETGQTVKLFTLGSGTDSTDILRQELQSKHAPAIFTIQDAQRLIEFVEGGYAMDLSTAADEGFAAFAAEIPESFYLTQDGTVNYGVPYNIEGYGYVVDKDLLSEMIGADNVDAFLEAYQTASYDDFVAMVDAMDAFIKEGTAGTFALSGTEFTLAAEKGELSSSLEGVFSVAGAERWTYGDHLVNVAIDAVYKDSLASAAATQETLEAGRGAWIAYAKLADVLTSHATMERGPELITATSGSYDMQIQNFANHKAVFVKQGNWCYNQIIAANESVGDNLTFIPIKLPITDEEITAEGLTAEHMNSSIPVFVPMYYAINAKASDEEKACAEQFLAWLNTTETGLGFIVNDMAFIPFNADPATTSAGYSLGDSILSYVQAGKTITNAYAGCPATWATNTFGQYMLENWVCKTEWGEDAYDQIADFLINSWVEAAGM